MKPNYVDPSMMHSHESIAAQNKEINRLYDAILPIARDLVKEGIEKRSAQATREVHAEEVNFLLESMFEGLKLEPAVLTEHDMGDQDVIRADAARDQAQWIAQLGEDFALAAAAFWLDLGMTSEKDWTPQQQLMATVRTGGSDKVLAAFDLLASRFYVDEEGRKLIKVLHDHTRKANALDGEHQPIVGPRIGVPAHLKSTRR